MTNTLQFKSFTLLSAHIHLYKPYNDELLTVPHIGYDDNILTVLYNCALPDTEKCKRLCISNIKTLL